MFFFSCDPSQKMWSIFLQIKHNFASVKNQDLMFNIYEIPSFSTHVYTSYEEDDLDDVYIICYEY